MIYLDDDLLMRLFTFMIIYFKSGSFTYDIPLALRVSSLAS